MLSLIKMNVAHLLSHIFYQGPFIQLRLQ